MKIASVMGRRAFLKRATAVGGLAALFGLAKSVPVAPKKPKEALSKSEHSSQGYQLTEHVKKYYETAAL